MVYIVLYTVFEPTHTHTWTNLLNILHSYLYLHCYAVSDIFQLNTARSECTCVLTLTTWWPPCAFVVIDTQWYQSSFLWEVSWMLFFLGLKFRIFWGKCKSVIRKSWRGAPPFEKMRLDKIFIGKCQYYYDDSSNLWANLA